MLNFLVFSISVIYLEIFWQCPLFSRSFHDACYLPHCLVYLLIFLFMSANISLRINRKQFFHYDQNIVNSVNYYWIFVHSRSLFNTLLIAIFIILCCFSRNPKLFLIFFSNIFCYLSYKIIIFWSNLTYLV